MILQANPKASYTAHKDAIDAALARVLDSGWYILGDEVTAFEQEFAAFCGASFAVGVASGTDALELALRACGVGADDVVFTVSHTAVATVVAIERTGAAPILVDIEPASYTMDPDRLESAVQLVAGDPARYGGRPAAVVPVHLYGHPAAMPAIMDIARRHDLLVIEDCAQAHGAALNGQPLGAWGNAAAFSFYPTKNLGALGDGGMVVSDDEDVTQRVQALRQYGWRDKYVSSDRGFNSRLDELQAAVLRAKLGYLEQDNKRRRKYAETYDELLLETDVAVPRLADGARHVYHQYVIRTAERDRLRRHLEREGVATAIHYPLPIHLQPAYRDSIRIAGGLSVTEGAAGEILSLPMYAELGMEAVRHVGSSIAAWRSSSPRV